MSPAIAVMTWVGVVAFSVSGVLEARKKQMDLLGVCAVAFVTAFGGGTVRDVVLGRFPIFWIENDLYLGTVILVAVAVFYLAKRWEISTHAILVPDAIGLGAFAVSGAQVATAFHAPALAAIALGVITATVGGVLRDIVCNEIPVVFARTELYGTCAAFGAAVYLLSRRLGLDEHGAISIGALACIGLRLLGLRLHWRLPA